MVFYSLAPPNQHPIDRLLRLFHTIRHLRLRQVCFQVWYRMTGRLTAKGARPPVQGRVAVQGKPVSFAPVTFCFLNREKSFPDPGSVDWNYPDYGKLWTYNLNYFEFLSQQSTDAGFALIYSWIAAESTHADGWEPYPTSLRLVSWIRFLQAAEGDVPPAIRSSIQRQYQALWTKVEYHLGGNHLLENAIALCLAANFLEDRKKAGQAEKLLLTEVAEQYLEDGAHYELSAMYHTILLDRLLTLWLALYPSPAPAAAPLFPALRPLLRRQLTRQLGWLAAFTTEDGRYAHFNDSIFGIAPAVPALLEKGKTLGFPVAAISLTTSGYRRWAHDRYDLWIDAAAIGPAYIPGHAHADNLTFVLHADGQPLVVDPGISTYEKNTRRAWERSTVAHNTVTVADQNSSDVWGGFRVGRRAVTRILAEESGLLQAAYGGPGYRHERRFLRKNDELYIRDVVQAPGPAVARFHFDYRQKVSLTPSSLTAGVLKMEWSAATALLTNYEQAVGWNECRTARCLELTFTGELKTRLSFSKPDQKNE